MGAVDTSDFGPYYNKGLSRSGRGPSPFGLAWLSMLALHLLRGLLALLVLALLALLALLVLALPALLS